MLALTGDCQRLAQDEGRAVHLAHQLRAEKAVLVAFGVERGQPSGIRQAGQRGLFKQGGTSIIIHAQPDDYLSQPAGNSGDRLACGIIKKP